MIVSGRTIAPEPVQDILMSLEMTNETKKRLDTLQGWAKDLKVLLLDENHYSESSQKNSKSVLLLLLDFFILRKFICTDFCSYI